MAQVGPKQAPPLLNNTEKETKREENSGESRGNEPRASGKEGEPSSTSNVPFVAPPSAPEGASGEPHPHACVVCRDGACLRMILRNCGHIVCVACLLGFLQGQIHLKAKVAPRCPSGWCAQEVHENDIRAVFDEKEEGLDVFMTPERRQFLQYCHDKDSIVLALAGPNWREQDELIRRCPLCKNIYYRRVGCNNVICPNLRCGTNFCWQCAKPIRGIGHFSGGPCRVAFDDVARSTVVLRMADDVTCWAVFLGIPVAFLFFHIIMPLAIFIAFPFFAVRRYYLKATESSDFLTPEEWVFLILKMILASLLGTVAGLPVALGSLVSAVFFQFLYMLFFCLKSCGIMGILLRKYDRFLPFAGLMGMRSMKQILKEGREEQEREKFRRQEARDREKMAEASVVGEGPSQTEKQA